MKINRMSQRKVNPNHNYKLNQPKINRHYFSIDKLSEDQSLINRLQSLTKRPSSLSKWSTVQRSKAKMMRTGACSHSHISPFPLDLLLGQIKSFWIHMEAERTSSCFSGMAFATGTIYLTACLCVFMYSFTRHYLQLQT